MSIHNDFICEPITNILERGLSSFSVLSDGIERFPIEDYVLQSIFLKMTGFQEQKLKCILWTMATYDYEYRYDFMKKPHGEYSSYKEKLFVFNKLVKKIENLDKSKLNKNDNSLYKSFKEQEEKLNIRILEKYRRIHQDKFDVILYFGLKKGKFLNIDNAKKGKDLFEKSVNEICKFDCFIKKQKELLVKKYHKLEEKIKEARDEIENKNKKDSYVRNQRNKLAEFLKKYRKLSTPLSSGDWRRFLEISMEWNTNPKFTSDDKNNILQKNYSELKDMKKNANSFLMESIDFILKGINEVNANYTSSLNLKKIYEDHVYKYRNRCAHNTLSYQKNLPDLKNLNEEYHLYENYYIRFLMMILIDTIFVEHYKIYMDLVKTKQY
ncbi:hypothetical protein [Kingella denitrificans]|uniref:hypothetical protein n=1 Tax=Kingella denitrificans TaxID=502 RepID=UPI00288BA3D5|nr:hypothetical protein [Kingella denitrificans]